MQLNPQDHGGGTNGLAISLGVAAVAGAASFIPVLTDWFRLGAAVLMFLAAAVGFYKSLKK